MEIVYKQIKDFGDIVTGKTPSTSDEENFSNDYPFITPSDIGSFFEKYIENTERGISKKGSNILKNSRIPENSICVVCIGSTIGKMCFTNKDSFTNQQLNSLIPNKDYNPHYLFYLLRYFKGFFQLIGAGTGSGKGIVNKTTFSKIRIPVFENLEFQNKIASILSAYDDLIEVNNKKIKTLNEMAQEIYKEWFVRFRFPGHEKVEFQNSILGSIPQDFKILKINDVLDDFIGGGWGEDDESSAFNTDAFVIRGTDFKNIENGILDSCPYRWHKASNFKSRQLKENDFILEISGGTAEQPVGRAIIVEKEILDRFDNKVICASFCKLLRIKNEKIAPFYFYYWLKYLYETKIIEQFQLQSTGIINFKFDYFLRKCNVLLPPKNILDNFEKIVKPIRDKIQKLGFENDKLIKQRDLLLPRLMSGKLEVKG